MHQRSSRSYPSCSCSFAVSSATNISYSSEAYLSQSEGSGPSLSMSWTSRNTQFYRHTCNLEEVLLSLIFPHRKCDHILMVLIVKQWKKKKSMSGLPSPTFCTANGSLCSWSRYFSRLKKVSKNMWAIRQRFRSPRVILPGERAEQCLNVHVQTGQEVQWKGVESSVPIDSVLY